MKLLVTGGAGYIGSIVALQLVQGGHEVTALETSPRNTKAPSPKTPCSSGRTRSMPKSWLGALDEGYDGVLVNQ